MELGAKLDDPTRHPNLKRSCITNMDLGATIDIRTYPNLKSSCATNKDLGAKRSRTIKRSNNDLDEKGKNGYMAWLRIA